MYFQQDASTDIIYIDLGYHLRSDILSKKTFLYCIFVYFKISKPVISGASA